MNFSRKKFLDSKIVILSERTLYSGNLEERVSALIPTLEERIDSFDNYLAAYEHCAQERNVGVIVLHSIATSDLPINVVNELSAPFQSIGSKAGLIVVAENETQFTKAYQQYGESEELLGIFLEKDFEGDSFLKETIENCWSKFEKIQQNLALPREELDLITKIASRFEDVGTLGRVTNILTYRLDRNWLDDLIVNCSPALLSLPANQIWILNNSKSLLELLKVIEPYRHISPSELLNSKDSNTVQRSVALANHLFKAYKTNEHEQLIESLTAGANAFAPTLKKLLTKEKRNLLDLLGSTEGRLAA